MAVEARSVVDRAASGTDATRPGAVGQFTASPAYRNYVVWLLFVIYVFNYCDRQILTIVLEQIKQEFSLHDWQLGALSGLFMAHFVAEGIDRKVALADGLRWSIRVTLLINLWSAWHYYCASKTLREDIATGNQARAAAGL